jgi:hypothetical protein
LLNKKIAAIVAASGMAVAGLALGITPAKAFDPVSNSYAIVGSDTLEDVVGALVNGTSVSGAGVRVTTSDSSTLASFDATGSSTIITKPYTSRFQRPNGSGDGRTALKAAIAGTNYTSSWSGKDTNWSAQPVAGKIDIVRGSSGGTIAAGGVMQRYTFGRDAIAYAYGSGLTGASNITDADMAKIYQCDAATLAAYGISQGGVVIPQSGSGTRNDFIAKLALTDASITDANIIAKYTTAAGGQSNGCISVGQEHDASTLSTTGIMPMSASRWIAMKNGVSYDKSGTALLGSLVAGVASVSGTAPNLVPVVAYYKNSTWGRDTYLFVDKNRVTVGNPSYDAVLAALFDYNNETSLTYQGGSAFSYANMSATPTFFAYQASAVKLKFGFLPASVQDTQLVN